MQAGVDRERVRFAGIKWASRALGGWESSRLASDGWKSDRWMSGD